MSYDVSCAELSLDNSISVIERRAAIDIGSGTSKLVVADVDILNNRVVKVIYSDFVNVPFSDTLMENPANILDEDIYILAVENFSTLFDRARQAGAVKFSAVATAAFRRASNGVDFINRLSRETHITMKIISQEDEAVLGFETAVQAAGYPSEKVISWDSGSGSIQLTSRSDQDIIDYLILFGTTPATQLLFKDKVMTSSKKEILNQITIEEAELFILQIQNMLPEMNSTFKEKLNVTEVSFVGIGSRPSTMGVCARACGKARFSTEELWSGILSFINGEDEFLIDLYNDTSIRTVLPRLLLTYSVMSTLRVKQLEWVETNGNCLGVFGINKYWK